MGRKIPAHVLGYGLASIPGIAYGEMFDKSVISIASYFSLILCIAFQLYSSLLTLIVNHYFFPQLPDTSHEQKVCIG